MTVQGQDWSGYQPATPGTSGLGFAFVKATEGTGYTSPVQSQQAAHARAAGLVCGFYHFLHPGNIAAQAQYFVANCASQAGDLLACDWESTSSGSATSAEKDEFLAAVKALRPTHKVLLYANLDFWRNRDTSSNAGDGLWIADYNSPAGHPAVSHPWVIHQYAADTVDRDIANFTDVAAMRAWAAGSTPAPTPVPSPSPEVPVTQAEMQQLISLLLGTKLGSSGPTVGQALQADIAAEVWNHTETNAATNAPVRMGAVMAWMDRMHANQVSALTAQIGALNSALAALAKQGGLTADEVTAAAQAGAQAALAELGHALNPTPAA